jgi:transcriptional regulator with XRE-family HTH domain
MARAGLGWDTRELAQRAEVGISTVNRFERGAVQPTRASLAAMRRALESAGVEFRADGSLKLREAAEATS